MSSQDPTLADRSQRHRRGLKAELREIRSTLEYFPAEMREVLALRMTHKVIASTEKVDAD
jgi:hypothetical protein